MSIKWPFIAVFPAWAALVFVIGHTSLIHLTHAEPVMPPPVTSSLTIANNYSVSVTNYGWRPTQPASTLTAPHWGYPVADEQPTADPRHSGL